MWRLQHSKWNHEDIFQKYYFVERNFVKVFVLFFFLLERSKKILPLGKQKERRRQKKKTTTLEKNFFSLPSFVSSTGSWILHKMRCLDFVSSTA